LYTANKFYEETGKNKIITPASLKSEKIFFRRGQNFQGSNLKRLVLKVTRQIV